MYCPRCGQSNDEENRFCISCGAELTAAPPDATQAPGSESDEAAAGGGQDGKPGRRGIVRRVIGTTRRERIVSGATLAAIVIAVIAFVLLDTPADKDGQDAFVRASDERCVAAKQEIARAAKTLSARGPDARDDYLESVLDAVLRWRADQRALEASPGQQAAATEYVAALLGAGAALAELSQATEGGSERAIADAAEAADEATVTLEREIDELGLERCGALSLGAAPPA